MNRITSLLGIQYPIVQGGMVWCSGWRLASAVSNAGGLGLFGAGSMHPEILREHIRKCRVATEFPFGVNIPLMYPQIEEIMNIVVEEGVKIIFTSAGNPKTWTGWLKERGITVVHIVSSSRFAVKCEEAGVDAVVAEGFEAGGHNAEDSGASMEELRTLLGRGRAKKGIFEGDLEEGELEIGQVSSIISRQQPVAEVMKELVEACQRAAKNDYL